MSDRDDTSIATKKKIKTATPKQFKVILLNDNYTTMDFVVAVLEGIFQRSPSEAMAIMLAVHRQGRGVAGTYTKEIAEAKIELVHARAESDGFPLKCVMEEA